MGLNLFKCLRFWAQGVRFRLILNPLSVDRVILKRNTHSTAKDVWALGKPNISMMVSLTSLTGLYFADPSVSGLHALGVFASVFWVAFSSCVFNQILERDVDAQMPRTQHRPLPSGRMPLMRAYGVGVGSFFLGLALGVVFGSFEACVLLVATFFSYIFLYTPLKRASHLNTLIGAIPGALPPVIGWFFVRSTWSYEPVVLFLMMFFWQLPHFLCIAWMYAKDYDSGAMKMLSTHDPNARKTASQSLLYGAALVPMTLLPFLVHMSGYVYLLGAMLALALFAYPVLQFVRYKNRKFARMILIHSMYYIVLTFPLMIFDRVQ